jgi:Mg2+ and Co2+ transporter CorA
MSFPYTPKLQDEKLESLQTQHEYLNLLRLRHLQWMNSATDSETEHIHQEIAELIEQITDRYHQLLDSMEQQTDKE